MHARFDLKSKSKKNKKNKKEIQPKIVCPVWAHYVERMKIVATKQKKRAARRKRNPFDCEGWRGLRYAQRSCRSNSARSR
jgi:hypothetical protein